MSKITGTTIRFDIQFEKLYLPRNIVFPRLEIPDFRIPNKPYHYEKEKTRIFKNRYEELVDAGILIPSDK